jgi:hypothetical protein
VLLAHVAFQAWSFNHSDISPHRINGLRAARDQNSAKPPFTHIQPDIFRRFNCLRTGDRLRCEAIDLIRS